jgi:hypothetical protein
MEAWSPDSWTVSRFPDGAEARVWKVKKGLPISIDPAQGIILGVAAVGGTLAMPLDDALSFVGLTGEERRRLLEWSGSKKFLWPPADNVVGSSEKCNVSTGQRVRTSHLDISEENAWWKGQESLVSDSDEQFAVLKPRSDTTQDELRLLGQRLRLWQQSNSFVRHICGLDRLLEGNDPRIPPIYLIVPYIGEFSECYEPAALVFVEKGTDHALAFDSLSKAIGVLKDRLSYFTDPDQYSDMNR